MAEIKPISTLKAGLEGFEIGYKAASLVEFEKGFKLLENGVLDWFFENKDKKMSANDFRKIIESLKRE